METRRLIVAVIAALAVYFAYTSLYRMFFPSPPAPPPTASGPAQPSSGPVTSSGPAIGTAPATSTAFQLVAGTDTAPITFGGQEGNPLQLILRPRGAAVESIQLTTRKGDKYAFRESVDDHSPLRLLHPVQTGADSVASFTTRWLYITRGGQTTPYRTDDLFWQVAEQTPDHVAFRTTLRATDGADVLSVTKTFQFRAGLPLFDIRVRIENLSKDPLGVAIEGSGPTGFPEEGRYFPSRRLSVVHRNPADGAAEMTTLRRSEVIGGRVITPPPNSKFAWAAQANKFFGVFIRPIHGDGQLADFVQRTSAGVADPALPDEQDDAVVYMETAARELPGGGATEFAFEVYAGPKNTESLSAANTAFADRRQIGYIAAQDADNSCCPCQFQYLTGLMIWLLDSIYGLVRNYGIAILLLVVLIKSAMHKLSVFQQKSMYRAQDAMARIHPKIEALKEKHGNDRQRLQQEQMKLYAEEGVNPFAPLVGFIPLIIQMPILISLFNALNTDVHLRHAPFDGWWIRDLSSPDALIKFEHGLTIPILSWLPWIGTIFTNIPSFNLLPIVMGVSMWLQQKYMPKPGQEARKEALEKRVAEKKPESKPQGFGGMTPEEQLRQQQMMANMMAVMFPIMFYYQPSGLALYWMFTNIFGICESLIIRKQIKAEKEKRALEGPPKPGQRKPSWFANKMKSFAEKMANLQKQADELSKKETDRSTKRERDPKRDKGRS